MRYPATDNAPPIKHAVDITENGANSRIFRIIDVAIKNGIGNSMTSLRSGAVVGWVVGDAEV